MIRGEWIVCESSSRWVAALRMAFMREPAQFGRSPRLYEVRSLADLNARLIERPDSVCLIEVRRSNLGDVLMWLGDTKRSYTQARLTTLLNTDTIENFRSDSSPSHDWQQVIDVLREAGADEVVESPRHLQNLLELGRRHASNCAKMAATRVDSRSIAERAGASLPWQDE